MEEVVVVVEFVVLVAVEGGAGDEAEVDVRRRPFPLLKS